MNNHAITSKSLSANILRIVMVLFFSIEILLIQGYTPLKVTSFPIEWLTYNIAGYILLFEFPMFLLRHSPHRNVYIFVGWAIFIDLFFDGIGNLFNLFNTFEHYDDFIHLTVFPLMITSLAMAMSTIYCKNRNLTTIAPNLPFLWGYTIAAFAFGIHELIELSINWFTSSNMGTGATDIDDTGRDLLYGYAGAFVIVFFYWLNDKRKRKAIQ